MYKPFLINYEQNNITDKSIKQTVKQTGVRDFFSFSMWAHFPSRAFTLKVLFGIFIQHFNLEHLNNF